MTIESLVVLEHTATLGTLDGLGRPAQQAHACHRQMYVYTYT